MRYFWKIFWIIYALVFAIVDLLNLVNGRGNQYIMAIGCVLMVVLAAFWMAKLVMEIYK